MAHLGGLAQLVERLLCKQDVSGSSPLTSTESQDNLLELSKGRKGDSLDKLGKDSAID